MKHVSTSVSALVLAIFIAAPAFAADLGKGSKDSPSSILDAPVSGGVVNWSGCYVGAQAGGSIANIGDDTGSGGFDARGVIGGGRLGCDVARGPFLVGVYGEYNWSNASLEAFNTTFIEKDNEWTAGARVGWIAAPRTLVYVLGGYTQADFSAGSDSKTFDGWTAGGGIELALVSNFTLGIEGSHTWYDANELGDGVSFDDTRIMGVARFKINSSLFGN